MVDDASDDSVGFHLPKLLNEHLLGNGRDRPSQVREAQHLAAEEMKQDDQLPPPLKNLKGVLNASGSRSRS